MSSPTQAKDHTASPEVFYHDLFNCKIDVSGRARDKLIPTQMPVYSASGKSLRNLYTSSPRSGPTAGVIRPGALGDEASPTKDFLQ